MANEFGTTPAISPADVGSRAGVEDIYGIKNARTYADLQNQGDEAYISGRFDRALAEARSYARSRFLSAGLAWPVAADFVYRDRLVSAVNRYAGAWLANGRIQIGQTLPEGSTIYGIKSAYTAAQDEIAWVIRDVLAPAQPTGMISAQGRPWPQN